MSYILEALKKSEAERQLGALPTIHAPSLHGEVAAAPGAAWKKPLPLAVMAMAAIIVALLALVWRQPAPALAPVQDQAAAAAAAAGKLAAPAPAPTPATAATAATATTAAAANSTLTVAPPAAVAALSASATVQQPVAMPPAPIEPVETLKPSKLAAAPTLAAAAAPAPTPAPAERSEPVRKPASLASAADGAHGTHAQPLPTAAAAAASDDTVQSVRELPEPIQRAIPPIAVGGYIYSKNPADRLLLIDKVLRHEGEEVAAGLVLEKLLPKAAVFNYKGYRYRVPY